MSQWWRVKPPIDSEFLVLVTNGRVAVCTRPTPHHGIEIGASWRETRRKLEKAQFVCVEEHSR